MKKNKRKSHLKAGMPPGSLVFTGEKKMSAVDITLIQYSEEACDVKKTQNIQKAIKMAKSFPGISWINIDGVHDAGIVEELGKSFGLHRLTMEDILHIDQRPKIDEHDDYVHIVLKMFSQNNNSSFMDSEQLSLILKDSLLISFQEKSGDVFDNVRKRIVEAKGYVRKKTADYLLYALIDSVIDNYFIILENTGEEFDKIETQLLESPDKKVLNQLYTIRKEVLQLRRSVYPLRELVSRFEKLENILVHQETRIFLRDLYDHSIQVIETVEVFRDTASGLLDLYMNSVSNKMNEVMKVLTIIATIFIPLTFIAGVYGMNFEYMPELQGKYAYFITLAVMFLVSLIMLVFFKRKKWI